MGPLSKSELQELYRKVFFIRFCEERIRREYASDQMKTPVHLSIGAEGIHAGVLTALPGKTRIFGTYRNHGIYLARTNECEKFFAELYGKGTGTAGGKAGSMHLAAPDKGLWVTSAVVATPLPVAVGAAWASFYRNENDLTAVFFGDGAVEEGAFWESLNFACLKRLRIFFICEDNHYAIHTPSESRQGFRSIKEAVQGFDCHWISEPGYQPEKVYQAVLQGMKKIEKDPKPVFCCFPYFRFYGHVGIEEDFNAGYRQKPSEKECRQMDPAVQMEALAARMKWDETERQRLKQSLLQEIERAVTKAKQDEFPLPSELYERMSLL